MNRTRDYSWLARLVAVAGMIVFGILLLGVAPGSALPTEIGVPTAPPLPPKPNPCHAAVNCLPPLEPCLVPQGQKCQPPTKPPTLTPKPPSSTPTETSPATPTPPPQAIPTPTRIETGGGSTAGSNPSAWLFLTGGALLVLAAGIGAGRLVRR